MYSSRTRCKDTNNCVRTQKNVVLIFYTPFIIDLNQVCLYGITSWMAGVTADSQ